MLHRDIKPSNIGYTADGTPKLLDFGLSVLLPAALLAPVVALSSSEDAIEDAVPSPHASASRAALSSSLAGTPLYLAPELLIGAPASATSDLWALAMVLYEGVAGRHPFASRSLQGVLRQVAAGSVPALRGDLPSCPVYVDSFFRRALAREPGERPPSATAMRGELERIQAAVSASPFGSSGAGV
jgi:serine/threonine protein kinase